MKIVMKSILTALFFVITSIFSSLEAQEVFTSQKSSISFDGGKNIEALNQSSKFIYRASDNSLVALINIKDFVFPNSLMQEHFNENYMESDKFPEASFVGKIENFDKSKLSSIKGSFSAKGKITIHGVTREITMPLQIFSNDKGEMEIQSQFKIRLADFKIKIPKIMFVKISEEADVNVSASF